MDYRLLRTRGPGLVARPGPVDVDLREILSHAPDERVRRCAAAGAADRAHGSLVVAAAGPVGSELVGQSFTRPGDFWGRPSAVHYDATRSNKGRSTGTRKNAARQPASGSARWWFYVSSL